MCHPLGLPLVAALEDLGLPLSEGQLWRSYSCLGYRGSRSTRYSWQLVARAAGNIVLYITVANRLQYSCLPTPPPREAWETTVYRVTKVEYYWIDPECIDARRLLPVAALPHWELSMKVAQLPGLQGPWWLQVCKDTDCLCYRSYGPIREYFFWASCSWWSEDLLGQSFSVVLPI